MKVLIIFLTLFLWTGTQKASVIKRDGADNQKEKQDFVRKRNETRTEEEEGEALNEMDFYNAKSINISSPDSETRKAENDLLYKAGLFEGDIELGNNSHTAISGRSAMREPSTRWPNATVPYSISNTFDREGRTLIARAISEFHKKTCLRFVPRTSADKDYIYFVKGDGCYSSLGRTGGAQNVSLGGGCLLFGIAVHEIMHSLGFHHENNRPDRDDYITMKWNNIQPGMEGQFHKYNWDQVQDLNESYDYRSVMHYTSTAFAKGHNEPVFVPKTEDKFMGQTHGFSHADLRKINRLYHCNRSKEEEVNGTGSECADADGSCAERAKQGECDKLPEWMRPNCMKACGLCEFSMGCNDLSDKCPEWSNQRLCESNPGFMKKFCLKSCRVCPKKVHLKRKKN